MTGSRTLHSTCPLDCPGACGLEVTVQADRLLSIRGRKDHPFTRGVICGKVKSYHEIQDGPRILSPMVRTGPKGSGEFREATWDEALGLAARGLARVAADHGAEAVLPYYYGGTMGLIQQKAIERLAHHAGWSRLDRTLCAAIATAGWQAGVGALLGPAPQEIAQSDLVILWGINAVSTHINLMAFVKEARRAGARLVAIDPYRTKTAARADWHLAPRPGTDGALACAMMQVLLAEGLADREYLESMTDFDASVATHLSTRTPQWASPIVGIPAATIRALARAYAAAARPFIRVGVGMSRQRNGAVNLHAISCLPAVAGVWPRAGAGALLGTDAAFTIDDEAVRQRAARRPGTRILDMSQLGRWLTDPSLKPPVAGLVVMNANPAGSCPDLEAVKRGLLRSDLFTVVHEQVMSDTARFADVLLPATTFLEHADLYRSYGQYTLQLANAVLPPRGQARNNNDVVNALARQLGYDHEVFSQSSETLRRRVLVASGLSDDTDLVSQGFVDLIPDEDTRHFRNGFPQPDGRFHFQPDWRDPTMPRLPDHWAVQTRDDAERARLYPLDFMAPPAHDVLNTTFTQTARTKKKRPVPTLLLNTMDATPRGIGDGDRVHVFNEHARLTLTARLTDDVPPGLGICESNYLAADFPEAVSLNALSHGEPVAPAGGPAFHDNRVQVERAPG